MTVFRRKRKNDLALFVEEGSDLDGGLTRRTGRTARITEDAQQKKEEPKWFWWRRCRDVSPPFEISKLSDWIAALKRASCRAAAFLRFFTDDKKTVGAHQRVASILSSTSASLLHHAGGAERTSAYWDDYWC